MVQIKIRGDSGEIRGRMLKPYVLDGVPTFGLNRGEQFSLILKNPTREAVTVGIFEGKRQLHFSGRTLWTVGEGYNQQTNLWMIEPRQEIVAISGWAFRQAMRVGVGCFQKNKPFKIVTAEIWPWRRLIERLREEWARGKLAGGLRASWQLFSRFED